MEFESKSASPSLPMGTQKQVNQDQRGSLKAEGCKDDPSKVNRVVLGTGGGRQGSREAADSEAHHQCKQKRQYRVGAPVFGR
jgi:hypothetical protein